MCTCIYIYIYIHMYIHTSRGEQYSFCHFVTTSKSRHLRRSFGAPRHGAFGSGVHNACAGLRRDAWPCLQLCRGAQMRAEVRAPRRNFSPHSMESCPRGSNMPPRGMLTTLGSMLIPLGGMLIPLGGMLIPLNMTI